MVRRFSNDEDGYRLWQRSNASGYVLNCEPKPKASYVSLHRANCWTISGKPSRGSTWTKALIKVCAGTTTELDDWTKSATGVFPSRCGACQP